MKTTAEQRTWLRGRLEQTNTIWQSTDLRAISALDILDDLEAAEARVKELELVEKEAHCLLVWTFQAGIDVDEMPDRGWRVSDMTDGVREHMNAGEQSLYDALQIADTDRE